MIGNKHYEPNSLRLLLQQSAVSERSHQKTEPGGQRGKDGETDGWMDGWMCKRWVTKMKTVVR